MAEKTKGTTKSAAAKVKRDVAERSADEPLSAEERAQLAMGRARRALGPDPTPEALQTFHYENARVQALLAIAEGLRSGKA